MVFKWWANGFSGQDIWLTHFDDTGFWLTPVFLNPISGQGNNTKQATKTF